jgi:E3 ubiquitin-protein ligase BIG BROTHER-like protein
MRNSQKLNTRYSSNKNIKIDAENANNKNNNINNNIKSTNLPAKNLSQSHVVITSVDVDYTKLLEEDKKKLEEIKDQIAIKKKKLEDKKKELNEIKEKNDKMKQTIYEKNKQLDRIKTEKVKYENLNNGIIAKINEVTQAIEEQRQRQIALLRRREMMMNYLMTMLMGLRRRNEDDYPNVDNMSYEELLALEERMGNVNKGLPKEKFDKLPTEKFSRYKFKDDKCIICQYEFKANEMLKILPCKHCFHPDCIEEWLKNQKACPYCKTEVIV